MDIVNEILKHNRLALAKGITAVEMSMTMRSKL